ncbi:MAG: monofunctional biosynthetic peptidoglycan transglycosylase [Thermodesulfobacteriota bacterium]|nr:monofunctional biosynthetic peptidoglycan transglycosylase [Thermodesulfobacteriota bacterium]
MLRKSRKIKKNRSWWSRFLILFLVIVLLTLSQVFIFGYVKPPLTIPVAKAWVAYALNLGARPQSHQWVALKEFSPHLRRAVLASEDQRFLRHYGFDFIELGQALRSLHEGGALRGASTISMQTARTMFLWPARSWLRKFGEAYYTLCLELVWSKEKILEFYLNSVDWGPGIHGGEAAALKYFNCHALDLDAGQAALLAAVLPGPHLWRPDRPTAAVKRRGKRILKEMEKVSLVGDSSF